VNIEAIESPSTGVNTYNGTLTINESDFLHRYLSPSCRAAIGGTVPCERIDVRNTRISFDSAKLNEDAVYMHNGRMSDGLVANLAYLQLQNVQIRNDYEAEYGISIEQAPDTWGTVSGTVGGTGMQTDSSYIRDRMTINGNPTAPITSPPLPSPPSLGNVPLQSTQLVRINNSGNSSASSYDIRAGNFIGPAGDGGATLTMTWTSSVSAK
jgi:hypothetical protein